MSTGNNPDPEVDSSAKSDKSQNSISEDSDSELFFPPIPGKNLFRYDGDSEQVCMTIQVGSASWYSVYQRASMQACDWEEGGGG